MLASGALVTVRKIAFALPAVMLLAGVPRAGAAAALDSQTIFTRRAVVISAESTVSHFGSRLNDGGEVVQAWNLAARFSLLPFGITRFKLLGGALDGSLEVGIEPVFERFETQGQNFAGLGLELRYYLLHFQYGRWVPWVNASIAPGGTDLRIGRVSNDTRLTGPFMNLIQAGVGVSYFTSESMALYFGLQAQHFSNAGLNGANRNFSLNTVESFVVGVSWFVK